MIWLFVLPTGVSLLDFFCSGIQFCLLFSPYLCFTRDVFYVRRKVDLMKTAKVNAYIMHIFGKIGLLSIHAT